MTKDEAVAYAQECAKAFCREWKVDEQEHEDYAQEAVLAVLKALRKTTEVNKSFLSQRVQWELSHYHQREKNAGFGSRYVNSPEHVYLSETVTGAYDEDGEPLTYGDTLVYEDPPEGYGDPSDELEKNVDRARLAKAIKALSPQDQQFVELAMLSDLTHTEVGKRLGISRQAVEDRIKTVVKRLQSIML